MLVPAICHELSSDLRSKKLFPSFFTGLLNGLVQVVFGVSFAAMIFSGEMAPFATRAAGLILFGSFAVGVVVLLMSGLRIHAAGCQDAPAATLVGAVPAAAALLTVSSEAAFMSLAGILFLASVLTGLAFFFIGRFHWANFFRFIPYPVVGGFLAGSGWFLFVGGLAVMSGATPHLTELATFFSTDMLLKWGPGLALTLALFWLLQHRSHYLILPGALLCGGLLYYLAFFLCGLSPADARARGFLLSGVPAQGLWPAFSLDSLGAIHWDVVIGQLPLACSVALVAILGMLLNISGVEVGAEEDIDLNREFQALGVANMVASCGGASPGYTSLSQTLLRVRTGGVSRIAGFVSTLLVALVLFSGGNWLTFFPKPLLGAFLAMLGLFFLWDWLVLTFRRMPRLDYSLVLVITAVIVWKGFLFGVAAGLAVTLMIFAFRFSRVTIVKQEFDLTERRSRRQRSAPDQHLLTTVGKNVYCYQLSGYLFFGSANLFVEKVRFRLHDNTRILLLDFEHVSGLDISAAQNFLRLRQTTRKMGIKIFLSHCPASLVAVLSGEDTAKAVADLETALGMAEDLLLTEAHQQLDADKGVTKSDLFDLSVDDMVKQLERLEWGESLEERLSPWGEVAQWQAGALVLAAQERVPGTLFLLSGLIAELDADGHRRQQYNCGAILFPQAQFADGIAHHKLTADAQLTMLWLSPAARQTLEASQPELALEFDRYILTQNATFEPSAHPAP